jgi:hypothetical protein
LIALRSSKVDLSILLNPFEEHAPHPACRPPSPRCYGEKGHCGDVSIPSPRSRGEG